MILIPPGRYFFREQKVIISKHFYIGKYEVTQEQWSFVMSSNPLSNKNLAYPVQNVSWEDCQEFSRRVKLALPTEAQWEYACRAGCTGTYYFGDDSRVLDKYAWYHDSSGKTVGLLKPNAWGTYDMLGNVWEWCRDWHSPESLKKDMVDPEETKTSSHRVARGGSWGISDVASCGYRLNFSAGNRVDNSGFRVSSPAEE
ncbi:MAG: formylglycine-generating enzyme family protein [Candidatus Brocadiae bacterium]|nr:formylglycine-generating enzyme family protein [Candidatus Brocadiia bacterium]